MGIFKRIADFFKPVRTEQYNIRQQVETDVRANELRIQAEKLAAAKAAHPAGKGRTEKTYVPPATRPNTTSRTRPERERDRGYDYESSIIYTEIEETRGYYDVTPPSVPDCTPSTPTYSSPSYDSPSYGSSSSSTSYDSGSSSSSSSSSDSGSSGGGCD